jgi:hypothetical protein
MRTVTRRILLTTLFFLAVGGFLLHYRIHTLMVPDKMQPGTLIFSGTNFLANLFPLIDVVLVTILFMRQKTAVYGFLLNGLIVIYGTIFMTHFSIADNLARAVPIQDWPLKSTLPDIAIAWADFLTGKLLYDWYRGKQAR